MHHQKKPKSNQHRITKPLSELQRPVANLRDLGRVKQELQPRNPSVIHKKTEK